jgi:hypothetical protein
MSAKKRTDGLPPGTRITLSRPDVSAREAVGVIADHVGNRIDLTIAFSVTIAGAADINGRLNVAVGGWDVRFLTAQPDQYIYAWLARTCTRRAQGDLRADALERPCGQMSRSSARTRSNSLRDFNDRRVTVRPTRTKIRLK